MGAFRKRTSRPGCSRRDSNPRYGVEGPESLTGLDYGSTVGRPTHRESARGIMSFRIPAARTPIRALCHWSTGASREYGRGGRRGRNSERRCPLNA